MKYLVIPLFLALSCTINGFVQNSNRNVMRSSIHVGTRMKLNMLKQDSKMPTNIKVDQETYLQDIINPTSFDPKRILSTILGQVALTAAAFALGSVTGIDVLHLENLQTETVILQETVLPALGIFAAIFTFSYFLRDVQLTGVQEFFRERKFYVLKTLGLRTDITSAIVIALVIALGEGFSDEVFFRGLCFSSIHTQVGDNLALFLSALISGLAHIPLFGSNFFVESLLSFIYGAAFLASGFNIVVPMTIHAIYSLVSMYSTWFFSTREISMRIESAKSSAAANPIADSSARFEAMAKAIFDIIDLDRSGNICTKEMKLGLRLFGVNSDMLDEEKVKGTNYDLLLPLQRAGQTDEISSEEFVTIIKEALVSWPKAGDTLDVDYWKK